MIVPDPPERFLVEFLPSFVAELGAAPEPASPRDEGRRARRSPSGAGIAVRVVGVGEWTLRLSDRKLLVASGVAEDVALQLSLRGEDFTPLIVAPVRRALETAPDSARALAARSFWTRLGRFDDETVDLLRRQDGRILVRIDDAGTSRNVALTPGVQQYSLDTAECCIDCELSALHEVQAKRQNPLDLFYEGRIRITGDAQIALAMAGLFL